MKVSVDASLVRTMIGRIEIITPGQRELLKQIAAGPASKAEWLRQALLLCSGPSPEPADYHGLSIAGPVPQRPGAGRIKAPADSCPAIVRR